MKARYFIAVVPPSDIREDIKKIKEEFAERFSSKQALKSPAHITLHMPFECNQKKFEQIASRLEEVMTGQKPFSLHLSNFEAFPPRVIYINVRVSNRLEELHTVLKKEMRMLNIFNADYKDRPFRPHATVAFRDLKKNLFEEAWKEFSERKFEKAFEVNAIEILKNDGKEWQMFKTVNF